MSGRKTASPRRLLADDFSQFKVEVLKAFKDTESEPEDRQRTEYLNRRGEDSSDPNGDRKSWDKAISHLNSLRDVLRPSKHGDAAKEDSASRSLFRSDRRTDNTVQETLSERSEEETGGRGNKKMDSVEDQELKEKVPASRAGMFTSCVPSKQQH